MTSVERPQILLVDDEPSIIETMRFALEREGFGVVSVNTGNDAILSLQRQTIQLVRLDVGLPDMSGFDVCRAIRSQTAVPIIFLTARTDEIDRVLGLEIGGDDYVSKPFSPRELVARVRAVLRRGESGGLQGSSCTPFHVDAERKCFEFHGTRLGLSPNEYRLLAVLVKRPGRVYSRDQLLTLAWDEPGMSLERTVDAHIKSIRSKLRSVRSEEEWIVTHRGFGYSLKERE